MNRVYGYARVSTESQNLDIQLEALKKAGCEAIFTDKISGVAKTKPQFDAMYHELRPGDTVVVYAFSRVSRSLQDLLNILERLKQQKVEIKSITEPIDTTTPFGKAFFGMVGVMAQLEREILVQRVTEGSRLARARGKGGGAKRQLDDKQIIRLKELHAQKKMSISELCTMFGLSKSGIYKYLHR